MNSANKLSAYRANAVKLCYARKSRRDDVRRGHSVSGCCHQAFEHEDPLDFNLNIHENITKTQPSFASSTTRWTWKTAENGPQPFGSTSIS